MLQAFFSGYVSGMAMSLMLGTVFFALIQHSINYGFKTGIYLALGVVFSDLIFVAIAMYGTSIIPAIQENEKTIRILGAVVLTALGVSSWLKKPAAITFSEAEAKKGSVVNFLAKGFLLNVLNPVNFFAWVGIATYLNGALKYSTSEEISYFSACLLAIFVTEVLLALGASKLRKFINDRFLLFFSRLAGTVFIVAAMALIWPLLAR